MWVWSKLSAAKWADAWEERFRGDPNLVISVLKGGRRVRVELFCGERKAAEEVCERFGGTVRELHRDDWIKPPPVRPPIKIRDRLLVTAEARKREVAGIRREFPGRGVISIPPEMAFGTGDHATTSTCLRMLADVARERGWSPGETSKDRVADLGTGSGVLAVAARMLGSGPVDACDFDPFAVQVAARNVERHGLDGIKVAQCDVLKMRPRSRYDVVLANLFSSVLIEALPVLRKLLARGGELICSGILHAQAWEVFEASASHGIGFSKVVRRGKWVSARGGWMNELAARG
jgi:ribosomal protein L11 methyltransferase